MIRLKHLLAEISLGSVTPYATSFVWRKPHTEDEIWECDFVAASQPIKMVMHRWRTPIPHFEYEYQFAFFTRGADDRGWSTTASNSDSRGEINVLALLKTVALAIRDFSEQTPDCDVIDVTGADSAYEKGDQKTRIYQALFADNGMTSGFTMKQYGGKLYLIRTVGRNADASGIEDSGDGDNQGNRAQPERAL